MNATRPIHTEDVFEVELCRALEKQGWQVLSDRAGDPDFPKAKYDRRHALLPDDVLDFVKSTQPESWERHVQNYNGDSEQKFIQRLCQELDKYGTLHILRHGFKDRGAQFELCFKLPNTALNDDVIRLYGENRLIAVRQLHYSEQNENCIDLVLFINGLPVATVELKTDFTQTVQHAITQYKQDRIPTGEPLLSFKKRALVHFAMSSDEVYMTTKLAGADTYFLPFNKGFEFGAGNPPAEGTYRTHYMADTIWQRDTWLDIITRFLHLQQTVRFDKKGNRIEKEAMIFPRYHQWEAVTQLLQAAREEKAGKRYLIQHSAGSGKSNSIAWLAHRLQSLHDAENKPVFSSVIIITDRRVLDKQLQETVSQFEHKAGVIECIDDSKGSKGKQLAAALNAGKAIILTTIQTFPNILEDVESMQGSTFAVIIDEAHSSQTGEASLKLKEALGKQEEEEPEDSEDFIQRAIEKKQPPKNISFYAFTATPKAKTIEMFGRKKKPDSMPEAFHLYTMRQAIEEGFILDVLKHFTPYKVFYRVAQKVTENPEFDKTKAIRAFTKYIKLHPYQISQKVEIIIEHFRHFVMPKVGGKAKAMVVTDSRAAAVRYGLALEEYIQEKGYEGIKALVAFSGAVEDKDFPGKTFTESSMNSNLKGQDIKEAFASDVFRVLIVANKFQTGFDEPLLHTMYVDKKLSGVTAVQTLSRLNRTHPDKRDVFVLDFVNDPETIKEAFSPYYTCTELENETDPNILYDIQRTLEGYGVFYPEEVEAFVKEFTRKNSTRNQAALHSHTDPAVDRFEGLEEEQQTDFRDSLQTFVRLYDFICQIAYFPDPALEKLSIFGRFLLRKLPYGGQQGVRVNLDPYVELEHFKIEKKAEQQILLEDNPPLSPVSEAGTSGSKEDDTITLADLLSRVNELFAGQFSENDKVDFTRSIVNKVLENGNLRVQAKSNSKENFKHGDYRGALQEAIITSIGKQGDLASQVLSDKHKMAVFSDILLDVVYKALKEDRQNINR